MPGAAAGMVSGSPTPGVSVSGTPGPGATVAASRSGGRTPAASARPTAVATGGAAAPRPPAQEGPCTVDPMANAGEILRKCTLSLGFGYAVDLDGMEPAWNLTSAELGDPWDLRLSSIQLLTQPGTDASIVAVGELNYEICRTSVGNEVIELARLRPGSQWCAFSNDDRPTGLQVMEVLTDGRQIVGVKFMVTVWGRVGS
ncbi:hypothetical protein ACFQY4_35685 [Catellatospora bangladeshensis]|uniref:hypothetical protein n=1 Tax=Catellatospora bangladeshensis TaxID=310355 RepID=UPI00360E43DF